MTQAGFDVVIIGAGSAGCTLAARLSEDGARRVLLIEAGPDFTGPTEADDLHGINFALTQRDWGLAADAAPGRTMDYPQGKAAGGGSAVNGGLFIRGVPADYDGWAAAGNELWGWDSMLPSLQVLEADEQFGADALHGADGPIPVTRWDKGQL